MIRVVRWCLFAFPFVVPAWVVAAPAAEQLAFFESRIRPVLVEACYECHSTAKKEGGLVLDHRQGLLTGGDRGAVIVPGKPAESLLLKVIRHQEADLKMPRGGAKLTAAVVADFERWIKEGAADPRDKPPSVADIADETAWEKTRERRRSWWSFQPLKNVPVPQVDDPAWNQNAVDRFVREQQSRLGLTPAAVAGPATLLRRVTLVLTGVPPTEAELTAFLADASPAAYERVVTRLLDSPRFGERWGRHWLDWFRYAETHGSEGDPTIPHAWRYRDYIIRALNADVSYFQLVREHIAGDLLPQPRINAELGIRESALGIGHLRMVQHGFAPTDAYDEEVRFIDNQIDVVSKAFLGMTVSCARCHHHKFDPLSQDDFYAWYGIFDSCRPGLITVDTPERLNLHRAALSALKPRIQTELGKVWQRAAEKFPAKLATQPTWKGALDEATAAKGNNPLSAWVALQDLSGEQLASEWNKLRGQYEGELAKEQKVAQFVYPNRWNLNAADLGQWFRSGNGLPTAKPSAAGEFHLLAEGEQLVSNLYPAGAFTHTLSSKHNGVLQSPRFRIDCDELCFRVAGGNNTRVRFVIHNYPRIGLNYPHSQVETETAKWFRWDCKYWKGEDAHLEITTGDDQPLDIGSKGGRSWFGALEAIGRNQDQPSPVDPVNCLFAVLTAEERDVVPANREALAELYGKVITRCVAAWQGGTMTDPQAEFLGYFVRQQLVPNSLPQLPAAVQSLAREYRQLENEIIVPTRAPGVHEGSPLDQPLMERGDYKKPLQPVARRFLEVFDPRPFQPQGSGRLELAHSLADPHNPLVARVIVNRVWQQVFGQGIVRTPDNIGRLGEEPTHPELLDHLAAEFAGKKAGSLKELIRSLVTTATFRQGSVPAAKMKEQDAENRQLTRFSPRRLEAEAIRDSLIAVSVGLDETRFGPSVAGNSRRRSIYVNVRRNALDPLLSVFDAPEPSSALGKRDATNVPAQSLTLLNDPFVIDLASNWAKRILADTTLTTDAARVRRLLVEATGREPTAVEIQKSLGYLQAAGEQWERTQREVERVQLEFAAVRKQVAAVTEPIHAKLLAARKADPQGTAAKLPPPFARWEFDGDLKDSVGNLHGEFKLGNAKGNATFESGALVLDGKSYVVTPPIAKEITAKTLEVWVQLDSLDQRSGGAITLETLNGETFDSVVFAEQEPRRWMAGSNFFRRTKSVGGDEERTAKDGPLHVAIVYAADGQITVYRDGKPYGTPYTPGEVVRYAAGQSHIVFGLRHSPAAAAKHLSGRLQRAQLHDRALSAEEVAASASGTNNFVAPAEVLAALPAAERAVVEKYEARIQALEKELRQLDLPAEWQANPARKWQDLCQALFSWKEFIYLR